jgi:hypothetical protein
MVLQAFSGSPVELTDIQFSAACPILSAPRLLQLKMSSPEGQFDPIEFKISSTTSRYLMITNLKKFRVTLRIYDSNVQWVLHCSGIVQRIEQVEDNQQYPNK